MEKIAYWLKAAIVLVAVGIAGYVRADESEFQITNGVLTRYTGDATSVVIPSTVTKIGQSAFYNKSELSSVTIPDSVLSIGSRAFCQCYGLTSLAIPKSVTSIGYDAFNNCSGLTEFVVDENNLYFKSENGLLISKDGTQLKSGVNGDVTIPEGVTSIGNAAFYYRVNLTSIIMPNSVKSIGADAFDGCRQLSSMTIPTGLTSISTSAFTDCNGMEEYIVADGNPNYKSVDGLLLTKDGTRLIAGVNKDVSIPDSVTSIDSHAFRGCSKLTNLVIPSGVEKINMWTFALCPALTNVTISSGVTDVGWGAFSSCSGLTSLSIPSTVTTIETNAFAYCRKLQTVNVDAGDTDRVKALLISSGLSVDDITFVENGSDEPVADMVVSLITTNIVIHYIVNSIQPQMVIPVSQDTGFVNIITEVNSGGAVSVPATWMVSYPSYTEKFGTDFTKSLMKLTGKTDGAGNPMLVWQDYVAGTDPTDENDKFTASITMVDGVPVISYSPELSAEQTALRTYKTYGKVKLGDSDWTDITNLSDAERGDYNFFKVAVEMK